MMKRTDELKDRILAKRHELRARLAELKADARAEAIEKRERIERKLQLLERTLKDGWDRLSGKAVASLNEWLKDDEQGTTHEPGPRDRSRTMPNSSHTDSP